MMLMWLYCTDVRAPPTHTVWENLAMKFCESKKLLFIFMHLQRSDDAPQAREPDLKWTKMGTINKLAEEVQARGIFQQLKLRRDHWLASYPHRSTPQTSPL